MNFFDKQEINILTQYAGKMKTDELQSVYNDLQRNYQKVEHWALEVKKQIFPDGKIKITKKPTNQANVFEFYQWAKIYPTKEDFNNKILAYTVSIEKSEKIVIKIDSVGLLDNNPLRQKYYKFRKENPIVKEYYLKDFSGWDDLINITVENLRYFKPYYNQLKSILVSQNIINSDVNESKNKKDITSLNQILYGPPGTGKTYNTINKSLSIIEDKSEEEINKENREVLKSRFDNYVKNGRIVFTTFHQSMSYEDFVEGIKPIMNEDEGELSYEVQNGIFKEICKNTNEINETVVDNFEVCWNKLIVLIKEKIADNKLLKIGNWEYGLSSKDSLKYSSLNSPSQYTFTITKQNIQDVYQNKQARPSGAFQKDMEDIVKYIKENFGLPDYNYKDEKNTGKNQNKNFVLIIDEINRGNVSQIFGELITLIEESKRIGNEEELKVTLPYSKKEFGVPSNLYIIGTMNTADRSVEALDTALRRRFSFVEMMPDLKVVEERQFSDFPRVEVMQKINQRIELLLDKNYTLGHSYFLKDNFRSSFKNEIIPLLQEYFYNDCGKIGLILGKGFVREKEISKANQHNIFADFDTRNEIEIIKSYELIPFEDIEFNSAIESLLV
ncbi:AAA family ATPase [Chryseobacterium sp. PS-8]|uniref:AAA family ATPase n=1 Tax=Chryseobacterium indicum TaxID=2766954 RepID=A0ABS9C3D1_9FLAO|nr:AAA family ATPase [Chryseobacterium sp. PS-8]MCF2218709.1 AAA family ATPase [Chryseobacterium sp. PS-8]